MVVNLSHALVPLESCFGAIHAMCDVRLQNVKLCPGGARCDPPEQVVLSRPTKNQTCILLLAFAERVNRGATVLRDFDDFGEFAPEWTSSTRAKRNTMRTEPRFFSARLKSVRRLRFSQRRMPMVALIECRSPR